MPAAPYIPSTDSDFDAWTHNFAALLTAHPTDYGLVAGDATVVQGVVDAYRTAYNIAITPTTRTAPTIATKDAARALADATIRPFAQMIASSPAVSDALKVGIGLNLPNATRPRIPAPSTQPDLKLVQVNPGVATYQYSDVSTPLSKAKPAGAIGMEVWQSVGLTPAVTPEGAAYMGTVTKSPNTLSYGPGDKGKVATVFGRWTTKSGPAGNAQTGPWSTALAFTIG